MDLLAASLQLLVMIFAPLAFTICLALLMLIWDKAFLEGFRSEHPRLSRNGPHWHRPRKEKVA